MNSARPAIAAALLALTGCAGEAPPHSAPENVDCGASALAAYVGVQSADDVMNTIRKWRGENPVRVLSPGSAMTMDYRPGRLNVFLDAQGRIEKFTCN